MNSYISSQNFSKTILILKIIIKFIYNELKERNENERKKKNLQCYFRKNKIETQLFKMKFIYINLKNIQKFMTKILL